MKLKVAIVGASGVLGRNLTAQFQNEGRAVRAFVRDPGKMAGMLTDDSEALPCDLLRIPSSLLTEFLKGCDVVIHAATALPAYPLEKRGWEWQENNRLRMEGTAKLLTSAWLAGVGLYLQQSVVSAYIGGGEGWQDENTPTDILPARAVETLAVADMERRVREIASSTMRWAILRGGVFTGPGTAEDSLKENIRKGWEVVPGDGSHFISPVHVGDMAAAFVKSAKVKPQGRVFNIVDEPVRYGDYVDGLADAQRAPRPRRDLLKGKALSHRCSNEAARKELGWNPTRGLYSSVRAASA